MSGKLTIIDERDILGELAVDTKDDGHPEIVLDGLAGAEIIIEFDGVGHMSPIIDVTDEGSPSVVRAILGDNKGGTNRIKVRIRNAADPVE